MIKVKGDPLYGGDGPARTAKAIPASVRAAVRKIEGRAAVTAPVTVTPRVTVEAHEADFRIEAVSDRTAAARMRAYRERKKATAGGVFFWGSWDVPAEKWVW